MKNLADMLSPRDTEKILENLHASIALVGKDGILLAWNPAFETCRNGFTTSALLEDFFSPNDREWVHIKLAGRKEERWVGEFPIRGKAANSLCDCMLLPISDDKFLFFVESIDSSNELLGVVEKLNRQVRLYQVESEHSKKLARNKQIELESVIAQATEVAQTDALTILFNRRAIIRELQKEVLRAERYSMMLSVSILDVDHFKDINDTYGHPAGDEVLRQVSERLRDGVRHPDIVGRYGGEEFIILLPNSDARAAAEQAARLCKQMNETPIQVKEKMIQVTLSIGVAQLRNGQDTWDNLLSRADNAMYEAKKRGRACWVMAE